MVSGKIIKLNEAFRKILKLQKNDGRMRALKEMKNISTTWAITIKVSCGNGYQDTRQKKRLQLSWRFRNKRVLDLFLICQLRNLLSIEAKWEIFLLIFREKKKIFSATFAQGNWFRVNNSDEKGKQSSNRWKKKGFDVVNLKP
jgi:hypothetical protein